jgi:ATP-binding protein involved in chromosome partitioning
VSKINQDKILKAVNEIEIPDSGIKIGASGWKIHVMAAEGKASLVIEADREINQEIAAKIKDLCIKSLEKDAKNGKISIIVTSSVSEAPLKPIIPKPPTPKEVNGIRFILAVASGKGGVGKSTIAANLAVAFAEMGLRTGLVDADIYGPSVARLMKLKGKPESVNQKIIPQLAYGVKCMTMGVLVDENAGLAWRGPMISKALGQLMLGAEWGDVDILVMDMPPGTGDVHLSVAQNFTIAGALVVTTSQEIALMDVKKSINMFEKVNIPVLGIIQNMAYFRDRETGSKTRLFGNKNPEDIEAALGYPVIAELAMDPQLVENSDTGVPAIISMPTSGVTDSFREIAREVLAILSDEHIEKESHSVH